MTELDDLFDLGRLVRDAGGDVVSALYLDPIGVDEGEDEPKTKRGRGRPKGSKNKPKGNGAKAPRKG